MSRLLGLKLGLFMIMGLGLISSMVDRRPWPTNREAGDMILQGEFLNIWFSDSLI